MKKIIILNLIFFLSLNLFAQQTGCISGDCEDGYGTYVWGPGNWQGDKYTGDWKGGLRHGFGTYYYSGGAKYIGEYENNVMHGQGTYYWADGDKYTGGWLNGKQEGEATYVYADGTIKKGTWKNGTYLSNDNVTSGCISGDCSSGYGVYVWEDGERYEGNWKNGMRNGRGANTWANGAKYDGDWVDDNKIGYGTYIYKNESEYGSYTGDWVANKMNGRGSFYWKSGQKYVGDFIENYFTGQGTMYYTDGTIESGLWENDVYKGNKTTYDNDSYGCVSGDCDNGWGVYKWDSGEKYEGNWENGKRNGQGTNYFANGAKYSGEWKDDYKHGFGTYNYHSDSEYDYYKGNYVMDKLTGQGTFVYRNGQKYVGSLQDSYFHGEGTMYYADGTVQSGIWEKDNFVGKSKGNVGCITGNCDNGYGTYSFESGAKYVGNWKAGKYNGEGTFYYANSDKYIGNWIDDSRTGKGTYIWASGVKYIGDWVDGSYTGIGTMYYTDGTSKSGRWKDNNYVGPIEEENKGPMVTWLTPEYFTSTTSSNVYKIKVCVESSTPVTAIVYVNGKEQTSTNRGFSVVSSACDYTIEREIQLTAGDNKIKVTVSNQTGSTTTEERTVTFQNASSSSEKRLALIIGNSNYAASPLRNPENDAKAIAKKLEGLGFEVMLFLNQNQADMKKAFRTFGEKLATDKGTGLFFYAGHGMQVDGENYLIPIGADIQKQQDVELEAVNLKRLLGEMDYARNNMNIIILDACRDNPFASATRSSGGNGLAQTNAPQGTFIAYATSPGSVAADGSGSNGLYTQEFLTALERKGESIENVFKEVRRNVYKKSDGKQVPWDNSSIFEDFFFNK